MTDEIQTRHSRIREIRLQPLPKLEEPILHRSRGNCAIEPMQPILARVDGEVREADFVGVSVDYCRHTEVFRVDLFVRYVELEVSPIVELLPLELRVAQDQCCAGVDAGGDADVLTDGGGGGNCGACEFNADGALARTRVVGMLAEPHHVTYPVGVAVA